jgi:short subunit dehydrogenase-like uncharacterized protein
MAGRIVLYGATGYMGGLVARALVTSGRRPVLAGRDRERLDALAARLSPEGTGTLETAVAGTEDAKPLRELLGAGDVLVSTAGPFMKIGRAAVTAAVDAGAIYLDSSGEPPFIRQVFEEFGPRAERTGAVLLSAFGYDYVPGNLAGALALGSAPSATKVRIGYFVRGKLTRATSAGTRASVAGVLLKPGYALRGGRIVTERTAAHVVWFDLGGERREALSIGSSEHFALPRLRQQAATVDDFGAQQKPLTDVGVYLGWFGAATRLVHYVSALAAPLDRLPAVRQILDREADRIQHSRATPSAGQTMRSEVVAVAADEQGKTLATVRLSGGDPYSFTGPLLAWAANAAATQGVRPPGALGPAEAFGLANLEAACADAGFHRHQDPPTD